MSAAHAAFDAPANRPAPSTWLRSVYSELLKAATLLSTSIVFVAVVGGATVVSVALHRADTGAPMTSVLEGTLPYLLIGTTVLGVLLMGSEYAGRQIPTSVLAVPRRGVLLAAKALIVAVLVALLVALWWTATHLAAGKAWTSAETRPVLVVAAGAVGLALFAWGITAATRDIVAALITSLAIVTVAPFVTQPWPDIHRWLPSSLVTQLCTSSQDAWRTVGVLLGWVLAGVTSGILRFVRDV